MKKGTDFGKFIFDVEVSNKPKILALAFAFKIYIFDS
jgi:hypothetical protein